MAEWRQQKNENSLKRRRSCIPVSCLEIEQKATGHTGGAETEGELKTTTTRWHCGKVKTGAQWGADVGCSHSKSADGHAGHCIKNGCCMYNFQSTSSSLCNGADETCCYRDTRPECAGGTATHAGCPNIVSRASWGARAPHAGIGTLGGAVKYVFIHHAESGACHTQADCASLVRGFQSYHMDSNGWSDIGYSFLIGEDGNAYEGRGWDKVGAHTQNYNSVGLGFCMIGSFTSRTPSAAAISTVQALIACGVSNGKIQSNYVLRGHRDMNQTDCPGNSLYALIKSWSHY